MRALLPALVLAASACTHTYRISVESAVLLQRTPDAVRAGAFVPVEPLTLDRQTYVRGNLVLRELRERDGRPVARVYNKVATTGVVLFCGGLFMTQIGLAELFTGFPLGFVTVNIFTFFDLGVGGLLGLAGAITWIAGAAVHPGEVDSPPANARILGERW